MPSPLMTKHYNDLKHSGLSEETIAEAGMFTVSPDQFKKCLDFDVKISLLEYPHEPDEHKIQYYMKVNPDNVLNKPIIAYQYNSWMLVYDGVHRTEANKRLGRKTVKARIIVPSDFEKVKEPVSRVLE